MVIISAKNILYQYSQSDPCIINMPAFHVHQHQHVFIEGPSGCGKTTFLNILTGLLNPLKGDMHIKGTNINQLSPTQRDQFRATHFGIIFQQFNLINYLNVMENIASPCMFSKIKKETAIQTSGSLKNEAERLCAELGIDASYLNKKVSELSIGQQQRVAIARALVGQPDIIVADEPTSALDNTSKDQFMTFLLSECEKYNITLIFVSHDTSLRSHFSHHYHFNDLNISTKKKTYVTD